MVHPRIQCTSMKMACKLRNPLGSAICYRSMSTTATSEDYQFLQRAKLPTTYFQASLPRLPIPQLEKTVVRYLEALRPILTDEDFAEAEVKVLNYGNGEAKHLNELLKKHDAANKNTSYISEPWFEMYISDRVPLPLNYNPLLVMKSDARPFYQNQMVRAANLVISSLRFWRSLQCDVLEPEVFHLNPKKSDTPQFRKWMRIVPNVIATYAAYTFKAYPLDMSQYNRLFGCSRIPELNKDRLVHYVDSKHIVVLRRGNIYAVDVLDASGCIESPATIYARLLAVEKLDQQRAAADVPLGVLTAGERNTWAATRKHFVTGISSVNKELLEKEVDAALFCLCLDDPKDPIYSDKNPVPLLKHQLAGEAKNRWFDKSVSLLVSADGTAAVNFEHSWGDGVAVLRYFNEIYKDSIEHPYVSPQIAEIAKLDNDKAVRQINFQIDDKLRADVELAIKQNAAIINTLNMEVLRYPNLNKVSCKRDGISPDSIMQLSFQLAYRQAFKAYVGTYESCSTAAFRHGRTETMRPCTIATKAFCESLLQPTNKKPNAKELRAMIDKCSQVHGNMTKEAAMGQGFDRHLFALKNMAIRNKLPVPEIYESPAHKKLNYNIISTSTLSSPALLAGSFGPVVRDGLGIAYSIQNDECGAVVTSYENQADGKQFIESLAQAFNDLRTVIDQSK